MTSVCHEIKSGFNFSYQLHFICQFVLTCVQVNINIREFDFVVCPAMISNPAGQCALLLIPMGLVAQCLYIL